MERENGKIERNERKVKIERFQFFSKIAAFQIFLRQSHENRDIDTNQTIF